MADGTPVEGHSPVEKRLVDMLMYLDATASEVARQCREILAGEGELPAEAAKKFVELRKWAALAYEEQTKIETLIRDKASSVSQHAIDFAEARAQIGRRLARLRAARDSGGVSE